MSSRYHIPEGLDKEALIEIHYEFLTMNPKVRVLTRWGDFTEYAVRIKARDAERLTGIEIDHLKTWRLCIGVSGVLEHGDRNDVVDVQFNDGGEWTTICIDPETEEYTVDHVRLITGAREYFLAKYPVVEGLLMIDRILLDL